MEYPERNVLVFQFETLTQSANLRQLLLPGKRRSNNSSSQWTLAHLKMSWILPTQMERGFSLCRSFTLYILLMASVLWANPASPYNVSVGKATIPSDFNTLLTRSRTEISVVHEYDDDFLASSFNFNIFDCLTVFLSSLTGHRWGRSAGLAFISCAIVCNDCVAAIDIRRIKEEARVNVNFEIKSISNC